MRRYGCCSKVLFLSVFFFFIFCVIWRFFFFLEEEKEKKKRGVIDGKIDRDGVDREKGVMVINLCFDWFDLECGYVLFVIKFYG